MSIRRTWVAVGAAAVLGVGASTTAALALDDRAPLGGAGAPVDRAPGAEQEPSSTGSVDAPPESADSPNAPAVDSAASASDIDDDRDDDRDDSTPDTTVDSPR